jgi:hypothetical protein
MTRVGVLAFALMAGLAILVVPPPALASGSGVLEFDCHANLLTFPYPGIAADCVGHASGTITGRRTDSSAYLVTAARAPFTAHFQRLTDQCSGGVTFTGTGVGTLYVSNVNSLVPLGRANIQYDFSWLRVGGVALVAVSNGQISWTLPVSPGAVLNSGTGLASFLPLSKVTTFSCGQPVSDLGVTIAGLLGLIT